MITEVHLLGHKFRQITYGDTHNLWLFFDEVFHQNL